MKMVKSLLLGSAAGFVAVAGAQAADLPVKAKPVEYVKVCSLYGAGFFYIPGTDTCIKLGGAVRVQAEYNTGAGGIPVGLGSNGEAAQGVFTRDKTNDVNFRTRIFFSVDARQQTDYGTLRTYFRFGIQETTPTDQSSSTAGATYWDRAFIQFAGFTVGRTVSFYDAVTWADFGYNNPRVTFDSGANGITLWAYTAQFGNGISATLSAEDPNGRFKNVDNGFLPQVIGGNVTASNGLAGQSTTNNGFLFPDVVGSLRVDQAWGSAQVMAAMHDASGSYYTSNPANGHPDNAFGWAVGTGFVVNLPTFGATSNVNSQPNVDQVKASFSYTQGATGYATNMNGGSLLVSGNSVGFANISDGAYELGVSDQVSRSTAWSAYGGYQHIWTPNWRTSLYGGYFSYDAPGFFDASCGLNGPGCFNFTMWQVGTRTQWNPVSQLDVGVDVLYSKLNSEQGSLATYAVPEHGNLPVADQDVWSVMFRVQRNFWP